MKLAVALQSFGLAVITAGVFLLAGLGVALVVAGVLAVLAGAVLERERVLAHRERRVLVEAERTARREGG